MAYREIGKRAEIDFRSEVEYRGRGEADVVDAAMKAAADSVKIIPSYREYLKNSKSYKVMDAVIVLPNKKIGAIEVADYPHLLKEKEDRNKTKLLLGAGYDFVIWVRAAFLPRLNDGSIEIIYNENELKNATKTLLLKLNELADKDVFDLSKAEDSSLDRRYSYKSREDIYNKKFELCLSEMKRLHTNYLPQNHVSKNENYNIGRWFHTQRNDARKGILPEHRYEKFLKNGIDLKEYKNKKKYL